MLTVDDPLLLIWRAQPANRQITDETIAHAIENAYAYVAAHAKRQMTTGALELAASYHVRIALGVTGEHVLLRDMMNLLMGVEG